MRKGIIIVLLCVSGLMWAEEQLQPIRIGLLLPLQVENSKRDKNMDRFADFYTGALLAVYEMQSTGERIEVYTYDVGKTTKRLEQVLADSVLAEMDMVIGPAYPAQVRVMSDWSLMHGVLTLLPFSSEVSGIAYNPYLMQFNPSIEVEAAVLAKRLSNQEQKVRCIFVDAEESAIPESVKTLQMSFMEEGLEYSYTTVKQIMHDSLWVVLDDSLDNVLLMNTERYGNLRTILPQLSRAAQGRQLTLISRYSWQDEPIILPQIYCTVFKEDEHIDEEAYDALYNRFVEQAHTISHPCYDLLGYDLMHYALQTVKVLHTSEEEWGKEAIVCRMYHGLQSDIQFERIDNMGGYRNMNLHIVRTR